MAENVERQLWTFPNCTYTCVKKARYIFVGLLRQYTEDLKYNDCNVTEKKNMYRTNKIIFDHTTIYKINPYLT